MHRRRALGLFATAIGVSVSSQTHAFADPASCPEHVAWIGKVMEKMETIRVGDTRKRLLRVFTTEGGLSTALEHTYVSQDCPLFKVDAKFRAVGRPDPFRGRTEQSPTQRFEVINPCRGWDPIDLH